MAEKLLPGSKFTMGLEICQVCKMPDIEETNHVADAKQETMYYCSTCESWNEGMPSEAEYKLEVVKSL